ncbi:hypothetical protein [Algoriphagus boritolerans]|uniref:hypothetical protein n=1 Tax=Algoriphagus boritolerans TaxID=308111 RepID=UPI000A722496
MDFGFDTQFKKWTEFDFVDLDQIKREINLVFGANIFLATFIEDVVQDIGQLIQSKVSLVGMGLNGIEDVLKRWG